MSAPPAASTIAPGSGAETYAFDAFELDVGQRALRQHGQAIALPSRALDVLLYLIENRDRCVRKDEIIGSIWDDVVVTDDSLIHAISVLRRALGDGRKQPRFIQTVPRRGYRFIAAVQAHAAAVGLRGAETTSRAEAPSEAQRSAEGRETERSAESRSETQRRAEPTIEAGDAAMQAPTGAPTPARASAPTPAGVPAARRATLPVMTATSPAGPATVADDRMRWLAAAAGVAAVVAAITVLGLGAGRDEPTPAASATAGIQLFQPAPDDTSIVSGGVLSPDGRYLAFVANDSDAGQPMLWVRTLHSNELRQLNGTTGASKPFWSPDSRQIAYFANGKLVATDLTGQTSRTIAPVFAAAGGTWGSDDTILFAEWASGLFSVPASGDGSVRTIATLDREADDIAFAWPQFFPDNRRFIYQIVSLDSTRTGVYIGSLDTRKSTKLLDTTSSATLAPPHHLLHVRNDMLIAEELDMDRLALTGRAIVVARGLSETSLAAENVVSATADLLAFKDGVTKQMLSWHDRSGEQVGTLAMPTALFNPRISPDGMRLLGSGSVTTDPGLWLVSLDHEQYVRLERDAIGPIWSPDGRYVALTTRGGFDLIVRAVDSSSERREVASDGAVKILNDWSPDGTQIVYTRHEKTTNLDLWIVDVETGATRRLLATPYSETQARISPDGQWIAYASDETGKLEIYVARFPGMQDRRLISAGGGGEPQWRADQRELFYLSLDQTVMAVAIDDEAAPGFGAPRPLFRAPLAGAPGDARDFFAASRDGTRFLIDGAVRENDSEAITVMVNWAAGLPEPGIETARVSQALP